MKYLFYCIGYIVTASCSQHRPSENTALDNQSANGEPKKYVQVNIKIDLKTPTVGIYDYTLVTNNLQRDSANAQAIIRAKVNLPLAMQRHDSTLFESLLAKGFICQAPDEFLNREEYIQNRVNGKWMISDVQYKNLVLEFLGDFAMLTYENVVKEKDEFGKDVIYNWFWTDVWVKEDGVWKIRVLRSIN